jgi:hypothetical protein
MPIKTDHPGLISKSLSNPHPHILSYRNVCPQTQPLCPFQHYSSVHRLHPNFSKHIVLKTSISMPHFLNNRKPMLFDEIPSQCSVLFCTISLSRFSYYLYESHGNHTLAQATSPVARYTTPRWQPQPVSSFLCRVHHTSFHHTTIPQTTGLSNRSLTSPLPNPLVPLKLASSENQICRYSDCISDVLLRKRRSPWFALRISDPTTIDPRLGAAFNTQIPFPISSSSPPRHPSRSTIVFESLTRTVSS